MLLLAGSVSAAAQSGPTVPATPGARINYAKQIERAFLSDGVDLAMLALEKPLKNSPASPKSFPQLVFFGAFGRPLVYKSVAETPLLEVARKHGFRSIDFASSYDGHWTYDLTGDGPLPACDRMKRLCR